ncbi:hypothetical protein [Embleya hyalina]|uniref:Uncharacterized protein n=1 Tax=Embleya hyalina TaxID=516124 RepID=A0A401Z609_9ACTN|nr:hypothetical protein [Embleya hyalina]GCE02248.1 hypothetical protein EHYA_10025 [Embleya hyalina]
MLRVASVAESPDGAEFDGGLWGDQQVWVRGVRPAGSPMIEPFHDRVVGEVVQWTVVSGNRDAAVAETVGTIRCRW